jgi:hypothetical protein
MSIENSISVAHERWSEERAQKWYAEKGWLIGCNYIPSNAINQLEMWSEETFDPQTIDRELSWAEKLGFTTIRVFLHDLLWQADPGGLLKRMDKFLSIADSHGIGVMFVIFDGVWDPNPSLGKREPKPFVHNSGWLQSPGAEILKDESRHDELEEYVKSVISYFANDKRIHVWDLFNEPDNLNPTSYIAQEPPNKSDLSQKLLEKAFVWAREAEPSQPLTAGLWYGDWTDLNTMKTMDRFMVTHADVITFHNYESAHEMEARIKALKKFNRPVLCTEYMARSFQNTFEAILPLFKHHNVGGYNWGFVSGKTQTNCPWDSWLTPYSAEPPLWFHDIFHEDGTPYNHKEVQLIIEQIGRDRKTIDSAQTL